MAMVVLHRIFMLNNQEILDHGACVQASYHGRFWKQERSGGKEAELSQPFASLISWNIFCTGGLTIQWKSGNQQYVNIYSPYRNDKHGLYFPREGMRCITYQLTATTYRSHIFINCSKAMIEKLLFSGSVYTSIFTVVFAVLYLYVPPVQHILTALDDAWWPFLERVFQLCSWFPFFHVSSLKQPYGICPCQSELREIEWNKADKMAWFAPGQYRMMILMMIIK